MKSDKRVWNAALVVLVAITVFGSRMTAAGAAINFVQTAGSTNNAASSSISQAFSSGNTAGNLIVVAVSWGDNPAPSISATDILGNSYAVVTNDFDSVKHQGLAILFAPNIRAGANTVTVNFGAADGYRRIIVSEYSGIATASPLEVSARNQAAGTTATDGTTSSTATTTVNGDLIFGVVMDDSGFFGTINAGTGFTRRAFVNNMDMATEDAVQSTAGPIAATFTFSRADSYLAQMAAFKPAAASSVSLVSLAVTPANASIVLGTKQQFTATGTYSDGSTQNLTTSVNWSSSAPSVATISNAAGSQGLASSVGTGSTTISAVSGSVSGSTTLTVTSAPATAITFVQTAGSTNNVASSSISQAFSSSNTAGNLIVVAASWGDNPAPSISASDTLGNSYVVVTNDYDPVKHQGLAILFAPNIRAGANTVTVNFGLADGYRRIIVSEYSGIATVSPLEVSARNQAAGTTATDGITSSSATTTVSGDLIVGVVMDDSGFFGTINAGTGFTRRAFLNNMDMATEDAVQTTAGPIAATFTFSQADSYLAQMAAFKPAAVTPATLSSLSLSPTSVTGGSSSTGTVTLNGPAPSGGAVVSLSSSNTAVATVPASVTVPAGATTATFTVSTSAVSTSTSVTISASYSGVTQTATLTVTPAGVTLSSLSLSPASVTGGSSSTGTVTLSGPAPSGGAVVSLSSSNTAAATVPASVTVPAGVTSATFTVSTSPVAASTSVTVSGSYGGATQTALLTVTPATLSSLSLSPTSVTGGSSSTGTVTLNGPAPSGGAVVSLSSSNTAVATVPASVTVPAGATTATFTVSTSAVTTSTSVTISGTYGGVTQTAVLTVMAAGAAINFVQTASSTNNLASSSISQAFSSSNTAGNLIVVAASWGDNPAPSISATDMLGNSYVVVTNDWDPVKHQGLAILFAPNIRAGVNTVTVNFGAADGYRRIIVSEYSGIATVSPLEVSARNQGAGTTATNGVTSGSATTTVNGDLIFGVVMDDSGFFGTINAGTGFTRRAFLNNMDMATEDAVQTTAGPIAATFTFSQADSYLAQMAAFKPTGAAATPSVSSLACNPSALVSGASTTCTVTLTQPAPANGSSVSLSSSNTAALPVPGSVTVPANSTSATFTATAGSVTTTQTVKVTATLVGTATTTVTVGTSQAALAGAWTGPFTWPLVAVHMVLMPTGKIVAWDLVNNAVQVWDPATNSFTNVTNTKVNFPYFCAGQTALADGRVLIDGGHINFDVGTPQVWAFDPMTLTWSQLSSMAFGRWYPTVITLADGRVLAVAGHTTCQTCVASIPEVYDPAANTWTQLPGAQSSVPTQYPHLLVLPDGRVVEVASSEEVIPTRVLDVAAQTWTMVDSRALDGGSSVMYLPGKVMKAGAAWSDGVASPSSATYLLDMTQGATPWRQAASMAFARVTHNLTLLPDGTVLVTGGSSSANLTSPIYNAELWSPATETWSTMAPMQVTRVYHSTALLLPDGRVLEAGSGRFGSDPSVNQLSAEIYSPPYLFKGARPTITSAPKTIAYGSTFSVATPDATRIAAVSLVRLGSVTHAFNSGQRFVSLAFQQATGGVSASAPLNGNIAPPGYYMLFILDTNGVPSIAPIVQLH